jgi:hypothetical protein
VGIVSATAGFRGTCATIDTLRLSLMLNTFPVATPAIPQQPQ